MMTEISTDLVKGLFTERGIEFEESDMDYIRNFFNSPPTVVSVSVEKVVVEPSKKKGKATKGKKAPPPPIPVVDSPSGLGSEADESMKVVVEPSKKKGKGKKAPSPIPVVDSPSGLGSEADESMKVTKKLGAKKKGKPKCEATTAKGTPCSKYACDGDVFCSVHITKHITGSPEKTVKKAKATKKPTVTKKVVPKHTHGLTSPVPDSGCDLCDTHGMPFEIPEYEAEGDDDEHDPTYIPALEEEDFDELD
jgi:hypothetical protein